LQPSRLAKRVWLLVFLAVIAFYFYGLGHIPFVGPDEPRYAQVAREMFLRGDLITPTLGGHTWFEKPPLLYWMMIASFRLFGVSEWAARLGPAISGLWTVAAVFWAGRRVCRSIAEDQPKGLAPWSALIAASTLGIIVFSRGAGFDGIVTMTITWALSFFLVAEVETDGSRRRIFWTGLYFFIGLSLLAKGLVGVVVPLGVVGAYYILRREFPARPFLSSLAWGLPLALSVAAIWYIPVIARHGWLFIDEFFLQHHFARFLSNRYHHPQPFYFYLLIIVPLSLPWIAFLIEGLVKARGWKWRGPDAQDRLRVFAAAWLLLPLAFFSFSGSKLPGYILPVLPAVALIAGERLARFASSQSTGVWTMRATGAICGVFALAGCVYVVRRGNLSVSCAALVAAPVIVAAMVCLFWTRLRALAGLSAPFATFMALVIALNCGVGTFASRESTRDLIRLATARGYGSAPVYALHEIDRSAEFYAAGRVAYTSDGEPVKFESTLDVVEAAEKSRSPILLLVPLEYAYQLTELKAACVEVIGNNGRVALVGVSSC
jgi:4-amino-4-deoxy-L-arabinose transferase-like glycosyltransferase